jgi:hypothetical protein
MVFWIEDFVSKRTLAVAAMVLGIAACSDNIPCPGPSLLVITSPQGSVTIDNDLDLAGAQTDVRVRTTLPQGSPVDFEVWSGDQMVRMVSATVNDSGQAMFSNLDVPPGTVSIRAAGYSVCGVTRDEAIVEVIAGSGCSVTIDPMPVLNPFYSPLPVLNSVADLDQGTIDFQSHVNVQTLKGWRAELFISDDGLEQPAGSALAADSGIAQFNATLPQGRIAVRSVCFGPRGEIVEAAAVTTVVDTIPPTCSVQSPAVGTTLNPGLDSNDDLADGLQLQAVAQLNGEDVLSTALQFVVGPAGQTPATVSGSLVAADGTSSALLTVAPATVPARYVVGMIGADQAGNVCNTSAEYDVAYDGCAIALTAPTAPITTDADGVASNGAQLDAALQISPACEGRTITSSCANMPSAVVPSSGQVSLRVNMCSSVPCQAAIDCTFAITSIANIETRASTTLRFDNQGPDITLQLAGGLRCNDSVASSQDQNSALPGVQINATIDGADSSQLIADSSAGTQLIAGPAIEVTLQPGRNVLNASGQDALGNRTTLASCEVALSDLQLTFAPNIADGVVGRADGVVTGSQLAIDVCGTVSSDGASVSVSVDGGIARAATVTGSNWCVLTTLSSSPSLHTVVAEASKPGLFGRASLGLNVDVVAPPIVNGLSAQSEDRQSVKLSFIAPADIGGIPVAGYRVKQSTTVLTNSNFDTTGTLIGSATPSLPGSPELIAASRLRAGIPLWFAVAALDSAGNRSAASVVGPITPAWDQTGAIVGPDQALGNLALGSAITHGRFNDDDFDDVAVAAPGQSLGAVAQSGAVFIYFGSTAGIKPLPDVSIIGAPGEQFGSALTAMHGISPLRDDLYVGAPAAVSGNGRVYVFRGGQSVVAATRASATAESLIDVAPNAGWFAGSRLGSRLVAANIDDDGQPDLIVSAPTGGSGAGGFAIVYGGTATGNVALSDVDSARLNGAVVDLYTDPLALTNRGFATYLHAVGPTRSGALTDDLVVAYADDVATVVDTAFVFRSSGVRAAAASVSSKQFVIGRDLRLDYVTTSRSTEWASQAITVDDQDGDGARDLVISAYRFNSGNGQVLMISGDLTGDATGRAATNQAGVVIATINGGVSSRLGSSLLAHRRSGVRSSPDVDGDSREDLLISGLAGGSARLFTWFGGALPRGNVAVSTAASAVSGPARFAFTIPTAGTSAIATWIGDINHDGLDDVCWSAPNDNNRDGSFEVLWDDRR